jgi:phosphoglycerate dehydrogenase-like enzyme
MSQLSLDKAKIRFLLLEGVHKNALDVLSNNGYTNIEYLRGALDEDALIEKIKDAHFLGIRSRTQVTEKVLAAANKLIAVGCFCIGTNQVNLKAAMERGIPVFNAPYSNTRSVAELVLAEAILLLRGIPDKECAGTSRRLVEVGGRLLRNPWQGAGHRRLRLHRFAAVGAGRVAGHAGHLLRRGHQAAAGQRPSGRHHGRTAGKPPTS